MAKRLDSWDHGRVLQRPQVKECAVVGLPSEAWGQKAAAIVVLSEQGKTAGRGGKAWSALDMRRALKDALVAYKIPQDMKVVDELPRNVNLPGEQERQASGNSN